MKAAVVTSFKKPLEIKQVPIPKPGPNDVLIKNIACGVCHTDLHAAHGGKEKNTCKREKEKKESFFLLMNRLGC